MPAQPHAYEPGADLRRQLDEARSECARLREENARLRQLLWPSNDAIPPTPIEPAPGLFPAAQPLPQVDASSPTEKKIALFRTLFRGRDDVYAVLWVNERTGKKGYSPACRRAVTTRERDKADAHCLPLTDEVIAAHLSGQTTIGVYPLLQDFLPKGGFGNLIALPLQKKCRAPGNTEFLDSTLRPWPDQWAFLSQVKRLTPPEVEARLASASGGAVAVGPGTVGSGPAPPRQQRRAPQRIACTLAAAISVDKAGLPPSLLSEIKHLASFHNPAFYRRQKPAHPDSGPPQTPARSMAGPTDQPTRPKPPRAGTLDPRDAICLPGKGRNVHPGGVPGRGAR